MKLKFPFKKVKNVCTTEQVIHQVDGQDKKLSEVLNGSGSGVPVTFNGEAPMDLFKKGLYGAPQLVGAIKQIIDELGLTYLYANKPVDVEFQMTSENSANIVIHNIFDYQTTISVETDTEDPQTVVGESSINPKIPEYSEELDDFISGVFGGRMRDILESQDAAFMQAIFDYLDAQYAASQNN